MELSQHARLSQIGSNVHSFQPAVIAIESWFESLTPMHHAIIIEEKNVALL